MWVRTDTIHLLISKSLEKTLIAWALPDHTVNGGYRRVMRHLREDEAKEMIGDDWRVRIVKYVRPVIWFFPRW